MGESPNFAQVIRPRFVASNLLCHRLVSEFAGLGEDALQESKNGTVNYRVFTSTWNVGGVAPPDDLDLEDWLDTRANSYDIYVLGFQEIVPLNARNVVGPKNSSATRKWNQLIGDALNKNKTARTRREEEAEAREQQQKQQSSFGFRRVASKQMVGIFVSVWARSGVRRHVRSPGVSCVGAGVLGRLGNKGAVSVRFLLHGTSFCFVCCHLASGGREGDEAHRNSDAAEILSRATFPRRRHSSSSSPLTSSAPHKILEHDRVILLGDLNYRISLPEAKTRLLVERQDWKTLLENDQLRGEVSDQGGAFHGWNEGPITFSPTYKYHRNSDAYYGCAQQQPKKGDTKLKRRAPAWCDRILWHGAGLKQSRYDRCESRLSDHRPVRALFAVEVDAPRNLNSLRSFFMSERFDCRAAKSSVSDLLCREDGDGDGDATSSARFDQDV